MRPPQFAGESEVHAVTREEALEASMRPPQFAGESQAAEVCQRYEAGASMRPPQFAGESSLHYAASSNREVGFNEAPAVRGGKFGCP